MLLFYFRTAIRNFRRTAAVSFINLLGLALGLATCLVAGLYIKHDLEADSFHKDAKSIYRTVFKVKDFYMMGTPYLFTETLEKENPNVSETLRIIDREVPVRINDQTQSHKILFADKNFLTFFTFPLREGNERRALSGLKQVVISHEMSEKYFAGRGALGEIIKLEIENEFKDFEITGVAQATPAYSSMYFDFVIPLENNYVKDAASKNDWDKFFLTSFIKVKDNKITEVENAMPGFVTKHLPQERPGATGEKINFVFKSYADHYLGEGFAGGGLREGKSGKSLAVFAGIALIILLLASFNFMNLTNAQSSRRGLEVGIKKVVGAQKSQLARQFLAEALLLSAVAAFLALGFAELATFLFRDLLQANLSVFEVSHWDVFVALLIITIITGLFAGSYPALILSRLNPLSTFKKYFKMTGNNWMTKLILSVQFTLSIILIISAIVMWKQQQYMMSKDLGYNDEQVLIVKINQKDTALIDYLKNEIKKMPEVINVSRSSQAFTKGSAISHHVLPDKQSMFIYMMSVDAEFVPTMEMQIVQGEKFKEASPTAAREIIVNETLVKKLGLQDSIGMDLGSQIGWIDKPKIVGVVKDFHHAMLKYNIAPLMLLNARWLEENYLLIRLAPGSTNAGLNEVQRVFEKTLPESVFDFSFLDENVNKQYEQETRWSMIITLATGMAVFLSILGLLGLAMFSAAQRRKEIGIRKVLGASIVQLVSLLSKGYLLLILISFSIAAPVSYYLMNEYWLNSFVYRTEFNVVVYCIAFLVVLVIASVSIGSQTLRAALTNPADTLKEE